MRYVLAVLILVFLSPPVHAQTVTEEYLQILVLSCYEGLDEFACAELDRIEGRSFSGANGKLDEATVGLSLSNRTGEEVFFALGNDVGPADGDQYRSQGWWSLEDGTCKNLWSWRAGDSGGVPLFFLIHAATGNGKTWSGDDRFLCTPDTSFDITSDHKSDCQKRGYFNVNIFEDDRLERGFTVNLDR